MRTLRNIVAILATMYAVHAGAKAQAIDNSSAPVKQDSTENIQYASSKSNNILSDIGFRKVSTETAATADGIPMHRTEIVNNNVTVKYDAKFRTKPTDAPVDIGGISFDKIYSDSTINIAAGLTSVGNLDKETEYFLDASITKQYGDITATLDIGKGARSTGPSREYLIGVFRHPNVSSEIGWFPQGSTFNKHTEILQYEWVALHNDNAYVGGGNEVDRTWIFAGIKGMEDFGTFAFAKYDRKSGDVWVKSQTAYGNADRGFFSTETFNVAASYLCVPPFFVKHFSPISTKGDAALKIEYKNCPSTGNAESEVMLGTNTTPIQVGIGVNTGYKGNTSISNVVAELYKEFSVAGIKGSVEVRYNNRTGDASGYVKLSKEF
jgi:hypothetical protein